MKKKKTFLQFDQVTWTRFKAMNFNVKAAAEFSFEQMTGGGSASTASEQKEIINSDISYLRYNERKA